MTTLSNKAFDTRLASPVQSPAPDDPANLALGATEPIDISTLLAGGDDRSDA